ncbi:hypothetical protein OPW41_13150 [Vibrio europaeus]|uniref:hypothetical protein n=1 Tax=Vibrio europaeus TaxID=300876 RepID=UPI00233E9C0D|nr:hypothetical protein [Vibrio europaeus]MDC5776673.1 hypothetical protein [Vibrio europaeus]MDC5795778.1 hypothetical protein [Vibrio europaeus]MDC5798407.1 hypothetical protein [Vibrio europaeus]MDC5816471.1 hypothetical protein [Vibrio europaeus]
MDELWQLLLENYEWVFSGIGVAVFGAFIVIKRNNTRHSLSQSQKSGANSTNIQAGGNVEFTQKND